MPFLSITSNFRNLKFNSGRRYIPSTTPSFTTVLDLQTAFTNLQFGNDRPGYGSSGLPYIQTQIPGELGSPGLFKPIFRPTSTGNLDYPIRGGDVKFQVGQESFTLSNNIDSIRIQKFFKDAPRGEAFINKQIGLQLTNPKIETGNVLFGLGQSAPFPGLLENTRVYNQGRNTLAQVKTAGTGGHALRHGLVPFAAYQKHYYAMVNEQNVNNSPNTNRLVNLNALKMTTSTSPFVNPENVLDINLVNTLGISLNRNQLFQYLGGPGSTYGVGSTSIKRVVDTTKLGKSEKAYASRNAMTYDKLRVQSINNITDGRATKNIQDFRTFTSTLIPEGSVWGNEENPLKYTIDNRFYVSSGNYKADKLNRSLPFLFENSQAPWEVGNETQKSDNDDIIKFVFECVSNEDPSYSIALFFRAFLTAGITDNNSAQLNSFKYAGRGENFYTYQGFDRSITFSFRIAAGSKQELVPMYNRLNALVSQVYPDYSYNGIMRAPLVKITIGDYIYRTPGFLESVNITVDNGTPWEIGSVEDKSLQLPQVIDVAVSFRPILDELPRRLGTSLTYQSTEIALNQDEISGLAKDIYTINANSAPQILANGKNGKDSIILKDPYYRVGNGNSYKTRQATLEEAENESLRVAEARFDARQIAEIEAASQDSDSYWKKIAADERRDEYYKKLNSMPLGSAERNQYVAEYGHLGN